MAVLIDTDLLVAAERGDLSGLTAVADEERAVSVITVSELLHGAWRSAEPEGIWRGAFVERLLASLEPIPITDQVARIHAAVSANLVTRGEMIGAHDLWIACTALTHGYGVLTGNAADFSRVPGLRVVSPA